MTRVEQGGHGGDRTGGFGSSPAVKLSDGAGSIHGLGEAFTSNLASGSAPLSVPLSLSPGRQGFGPGIDLRYDSSSGNGPFGVGWHISIPAVARKTSKALPVYTSDVDTFTLSDAEDLVEIGPRESAP